MWENIAIEAIGLELVLIFGSGSQIKFQDSYYRNWAKILDKKKNEFKEIDFNIRVIRFCELFINKFSF